MNLIFPNKFDGVIVCGDIHGDFMPLVFKVNDQYKIENSLIIVAGDSGVGFHEDGYYTTIFKKASKRLKEKNNIILLMRGNHDDPDKWNDYEPFKEFWQDSDSNIRLIKDYTTVTAHTDRNSHNILCVGGAISIDRKPSEFITGRDGRPWPGRTIGKNYWPGEPFVYDESKVENLVAITDVITHSAPDFCEPIIKNNLEKWMMSDPELKEDCDNERQNHTNLYTKLKEKNVVRTWHYAHFHFFNRTYVDNTLFRLCDIMELVEL